METTLNLHEGFGQCGESIKFKRSTFPGGEVYIKIEVPQQTNSCRINSRCNDANDLLTILMAIDALKKRGVDDLELFIPYFPYSRQDRVCEIGESFSLKVICKILLQLDLRSIITYDVHSNVASTLLDNLCNINNRREIIDFISYLNLKKQFALICPDQGASKKAQELYFSLPDSFSTMVYCNKTRKNGMMMIDIPNSNNIKGRDCLIVDDICDGGATFIELGKKLKEAKARDLYLFVSHGIFSKGVSELGKYYKKIGSTNSIKEDYDYDDDGNEFDKSSTYSWQAIKTFNLNY